MSMRRDVDPSSYMGRYLAMKFPERGPFKSVYFEGSYYDRATTTYFDRDGKEVEREDHGYYG
jgi:hypothetical protein